VLRVLVGSYLLSLHHGLALAKHVRLRREVYEFLIVFEWEGVDMLVLVVLMVKCGHNVTECCIEGMVRQLIDVLRHFFLNHRGRYSLALLPNLRILGMNVGA